MFCGQIGPAETLLSFSLSLSATDLLLSSNSLFFLTSSSLFLLNRILSHCGPGTIILSQPDPLIARRAVPDLYPPTPPAVAARILTSQANLVFYTE